MRFAIFGAGGLGAYYGARLAEAGHEVGFVARGAQLAALKKQGLRLTSPLGDVHLKHPVASAEPGELGVADVVIVAVKTWQLPDALAEALGAAHVLGGLSRVFSMLESPGVARHLNSGASVEFGELAGGASPRAAALAEAFARAKVDAKVSEDIRTELWKKLVTVSSWSGLGALARSPMGVLRKIPETRALIDRAVDEGMAVGLCRGHALFESFKEELWRFYDALPAEATASMQRDLMAGKPSELDAWNGAIVRFGAACGVDTPVHAFTLHALLPMERRARGAL